MIAAPRLRGNIGRFQFLGLGFGTMIGSAWVILLGDWLGKAGPGGAVLGFLAGTVVVMTVGACYAELTGYLPEAGSEFLYAHRVYGSGVAFAVGWFLVLYLVSVTVFEALAFAWIVEILISGWKAQPLYQAFGATISSETLIVGISGGLIILGLNLRGARVAVMSHTVLTYGFAMVVLGILLALLANGRLDNAEPLFASTTGRPWWLGSGAIFAFCAYGLNGFQAIPHAVEERSTEISLRTVGRILVGAIAAAGSFYCLVVLCASVIVPWRSLVGAQLPMAAAVRALPFGGVFATVLLLATGVSLFKAWNGVFMMAARLVLAMARAGFVPAPFARLDARTGSPSVALIAIAACTIAGIFFGKGAIEPITDMSAMVLTLTYVLCCFTVLRIRRSGAQGHFRVPGGEALIWLGIAGSALMAAFALLTPFWETRGVPLEWRLLSVWGALGLLVWWSRIRRIRGASAASGEPLAAFRPPSLPSSPSSRESS